MRIAITGGTGFVGRHVAARLSESGHDVVSVARGDNRPDLDGPGVTLTEASVADAHALERAFAGCLAVVHCAGINRELGSQTFSNVHVVGTRNVVAAARKAGVERLVMLSFLRARPDCASGYHESKWAAEEIVRYSGLEWTIVKAGVIYGRGDHMLDHISRALHTLPLFPVVGFDEPAMRPVAVDDVARILAVAALRDDRLIRRTVAVLGPDELSLRQAVHRIARVAGRRPLVFPLPVRLHRLLAWIEERLMVVTLTSLAQVRILSEGIVEPLPYAEPPPDDLVPTTPFDEASIRAGLPAPGGFGLRDLRAFA